MSGKTPGMEDCGGGVDGQSEESVKDGNGPINRQLTVTETV